MWSDVQKNRPLTENNSSGGGSSGGGGSGGGAGDSTGSSSVSYSRGTDHGGSEGVMTT